MHRLAQLAKAATNVVVRQRLLSIGLAVVFVGALTISLTGASTPITSNEAESGNLASCASSISDSSASGGSAVSFADCGGAGSAPWAGAGAQLPISYNLSSLPGNTYFVDDSGSDSNYGSESSPFATLSKAIDAADSGDSIVLRQGLYRGQGNLTINKSLTITAYPGEIPVFNGAQEVSNTSGWTADSSLSYHAYTPMPVTSGSGINFGDCQNQTSSCVGQYPDQVWQGGSQLEQVGSKGSVSNGKFWVDQSNDRLYMTTADVDNGDIEVSDMRKFAAVNAANVTLRGFRIIRYSNTADDYGVVSYTGGADNSLIDNMFISDTAFMAVNYGPTGNDVNENSTIKDSTIRYSNWMGVSANTTTSFTLEHSNVSHMDQFDEFTASPQSGALKTSRTWYTKVLNSQINDNKSHALWFDQSNYQVTVAGSDIENNTGGAIFFEISDFVYAINNYIYNNDGTSLEVSASSDAYLINNTIIGSGQPVGVYTDHRSVPGCSDPSLPLCSEVKYSSDLDHNPNHPHPNTMTWIPGINLMINNIIGYPSGSVYCGSNFNFCITQKNSTTSVTLDKILHQADTSEGVPQTLIDGNIYANGSHDVIRNSDTSGSWTNYSTGAAFGAAMANPPVSIVGFGANGYTGDQYVNSDGTPTSTLNGLVNNAVPTPNDAAITPYIPAGTKHYGVTWN